MSQPVLTWKTRLEEKLRLLPNRPGVYLMKDGRGKVLYIGKAKRLPPRVRSYFRGQAGDPRLQLLRDRIRDFDYLVTANEGEALVLEANLVRSQKPHYNIELKDDKKYPFLKVNVQHEYPRLVVTRTIIADGSRYFGPYTRVKDLRQVLRSLRRLFPLRSCTDRRLRQGGRPCLDYFIDICTAPCAGFTDPETYRRVTDRLIRFLEGKGEHIARESEAQMRALARELKFEESARLRDDIERLAQLHERQRITDLERPDLDVVALVARGNRAMAAVLSHREGQVVGTWRIRVGSAENAEAPEIMETVLSDHYQGREQIPALILCRPLPADRPLLEKWLSDRAEHKVRLIEPKRGRRAEIVRAVQENAHLSLEEEELIERGRRKRLAESAYALQQALGLPRAPARIEGYDISNLQGSLAVGSQVVFRDGQPLKSAYRRYRIRDVVGPDDVDMLAEVVSRRMRHLEERQEAIPDLILIDGGKGQVNRAARVLRDAGRGEIPIIGLAKREEEIFLPGRSEPIRLAGSSPGLQLLQRVRDEAHRFAIEYHRRLRSRRMKTGPLEEVAGLGPKRRAALLEHFGSLAALSAASIEQLAEVPGIGPQMAEAIRRGLGRA